MFIVCVSLFVLMFGWFLIRFSVYSWVLLMLVCFLICWKCVFIVLNIRWKCFNICVVVLLRLGGGVGWCVGIS